MKFSINIYHQLYTVHDQKFQTLNRIKKIVYTKQCRPRAYTNSADPDQTTPNELV